MLVTAGAYGSARGFCTEVLAGFGESVALYDPELGAGIAAALDPRTRLVIVESPGSVATEVQDLPAIASAARASGAIVLADNSWASALLCNPLDRGADIVVEALSEHVGDHGDLLLGALVTRDDDLVRRLEDTARLLGLGVPPDDASLAPRGLQTRRSASSARAPRPWRSRTGWPLDRRSHASCIRRSPSIRAMRSGRGTSAARRVRSRWRSRHPGPAVRPR